jgi:hypothetical protein
MNRFVPALIARLGLRPAAERRCLPGVTAVFSLRIVDLILVVVVPLRYVPHISRSAGIAPRPLSTTASAMPHPETR